MRHYQSVVFSIALTALAGCRPDPVTGPAGKSPQISADFSNDCSTQVITDPECENPPGDTWVYEYYGDVDGSAEISAQATSDNSESSPVWCTSFVKNLVSGRIESTPPLTFTSSGTFTVISRASMGWGTYRWPEGWWPATDGSGREVKIGTADAACWFGPISPGVSALQRFFYAFHNTEIRKLASNPGTGGGPPGGNNCETQWIVVEIDRGTGNGWEVLWEGYGTVCS